MVFSDLFFLFAFLPSFFLSYIAGGFIDRLLSRGELETHQTVRNLVLVCFSLLFYAWGEPVYVLLMLGCVVWNYVAGLCIDRSDRRRRLMLALGVAGDLVILGTFKYAGFFARTLTDFGLPVPDPHITLPIGISFYTFQSISYLVDVYRREAPVQRRFLGLLLYISMFPQLIAGPIVRYDTVAREISCRRVSVQDVADGLYRFLIGLGKKVILANQLSEVSDMFLKADLAQLPVSAAWVGLLAFSLQIYFDFSGYSDMAIGLGRCLGFHFNENFNHPYICRSISEFWRRWHMSLGSFFRDYVYIPMGGNRRHQPLNIFVVWFLTGMWHGASWNFIVWGLYFGLIVMLEKYTILRLRSRWFYPFLHVYSLALIFIGWGIFYFEDWGRMTQFFTIFFGQASNALHDATTESALLSRFWLWVVALVLCLPVRRWLSQGLTWSLGGVPAMRTSVALVARLLLSLAILAASTALLVGATNNAFLYFNF